MDDLAARLRLLADPARLRLLRLCAREELNAGELASILGLGQSTVSRHLAQLREAGLLAERREGRYSFFAIGPAAAEGPAAGVLGVVRGAPDDAGDLVRLDDVLRSRRERQLAAPDGAGKRPFVPGRSWAAWARALTWLVPPGLRAADLGCGDGALTLELARFAAEVAAVDANPALIRAAKALARRRGVRNVRFEVGDVAALPLAAASTDLVLFSQSLHALPDPAAALAEAVRILVPGGRVLVLDLLPHREEWVRERLGHRHLGFAPKRLVELLEDAGLEAVQTDRRPARPDDPFRVLLATGLRPRRRSR